MKGIIQKKEARSIEKAITFLVENINKTGKNPKPVILHSLEIAFYLLEKQYAPEIVIAAILHDILEDTEVKEGELKKEFGSEVVDIIKAVSYSEEIENWTEKYCDVFKRTLKQGKDALILKCADIYQNSFYIKLAKSTEFQRELVEKIGYFLKISQGIIGSEVVWRDLEKQYESEKRRIGGGFILKG